MKLLVTGGAGFIGSAVVRQAVQLGVTVINLDALTYAANLESLDVVSKSELYYLEHVDIRDRASLDKVFLHYRPDAVMHLAAESHVDRSIDSPADFVSTNLLGTFNLLEAARRYWNAIGQSKNFRFHHVSTDEVYGSLPNDPNLKFIETSSYDPRSPYSASKAGSDHLVRAWYYTYGLPVVMTNSSNNYGPHQFPEKLIPVIIINALYSQRIPIYGSGQNVRDWLFVEDHARALLMVLTEGSVGESYNVGGCNEVANIDIARMICEILDTRLPRDNGNYDELIEFVADRPGHDFRYAVDSSKLRETFAWRPSVTLRQGLERTVDWYIANEDWWKPLLKRDGVGRRLGEALR